MDISASDTFHTVSTPQPQGLPGHFEALLGDTLLDGEIARPAHLISAMRHGVLNGGKRLRPFLVIETARMLGAT
jgi:farnesyl diphosphate synthase